MEDAGLLYQLMNTDKFLNYAGDRNISSVAKASDYIEEKIRPQIARLGYGAYTVQLKSDHTKIGTCGLYDRDGVEGIDLGYGLLPDFEGKGYAREAARQMIEMAFSELGLNELKAITSKDNHQSTRLLTDLGFIKSDCTQLPDEEEELYLFTLNSSYESHSNSKS